MYYLINKGEARYSELEKNVVKTRSVLSVALQDLTNRGLIKRMVKPTKPIETRYRLTRKGNDIIQLIDLLETVLKRSE